MILHVIAYLAIVGLLIAAGACLAEEALRLAGRPVRWAWSGAISLTLLALVLAPFRFSPESTASVPRTTIVASSAEAFPQAASNGGWTPLHALSLARGAAAGLPQRLADTLQAHLPSWVGGTAAALWLVLSGSLVLVGVVVHARFARVARSSETAVLVGRQVRVSRDVGPAVVGLLRPVVVVPDWLLRADAAEQRVVVEHEQEHIAAGDQWLLALGCVLVAVLPWHPASWWMLSRLRLAVEMDCDRRVLARGIARRAYGEALIDLAARCGRLPRTVAALSDHSSHLERRLLAMTTAPITNRRSRMLAFGCATLLMVTAACEARLPSAPEIEQMDAAAAERNVLATAASRTDSIEVYRIDGVRVTAAQAHGLSPAEIASIEMVFSRGRDREPTAMNITTRAAAGAEAEAGSPADARPDVVLEAGTTTMRDGSLVAERPIRLGGMGSFEGLVLVDGVRVDPASIQKLKPESITAVEVLKGAAATRLHSEPEAARGVIHITTLQPPR